MEELQQKKKGIFDPSIAEHRERLAHATPMLESATEVGFFDLLIPVRENARIPVRVYAPQLVPNDEDLPTLFYIPGTGFVGHETKFTQVVCSHLAKMAKCRVITINHRLAPENPFPASFLDCYEVIKFFCLGTQGNLIVNKSKMVIAGYSSGGTLAALISSKAKKDGIHFLRQVLISPLMDLSRSLKGFEEFEKKDTDISQEFANWIIDLYLPENANPKDPAISPFWLPKKELREYPATDILIGEYDRFRNDAEFFYLKLKLCGLPVEKYVASGEKHSYLWYKLEVTEKIAECLKRAFGDQTSDLKNRSTILNICPRIEAETNKNIKDSNGLVFQKSKM